MTFLLSVSRGIDALNERVGKAVIWLVLLMTILSAGNAVMRYTINYSSNGLLEIQWYLFAAIFLLCSPYTLQKNEHVRIDVLSGKLSPRGLAVIDIIGTLFFMLRLSAATAAMYLLLWWLSPTLEVWVKWSMWRSGLELCKLVVVGGLCYLLTAGLLGIRPRDLKTVNEG